VSPTLGIVSDPQFVRLMSVAQWRFASTMPQWPHVYTVRGWWPAPHEFAAACSHIKGTGRIIPWPSPPEMPIYHNRYLVLDPFKFWAMGPHGDQDGVDEQTVINCEFADHDDLLDCAPTDSVNHTGAWSDLLTRLSGLLHAGSTRGGETIRRPTS
jgi:hypothetical protein